MTDYVVRDTQLTSVADAIRAKGGTSDPLTFPDGFVDAVEAIPTGGGASVEPLSVTQNGTYTAPTGTAYSPVTVNVSGGPVSVPAKEVNFRDYDGTVVYSYTPAEFAALSAMPTNPDHSSDEIPLTAQGWNWSFADAQAYVAKYGRLEVGQMYATSDGKTHVLIHLEKGRTSPLLGCCPDGTVDVDWGDGTAHDTLAGTSVTTVKWTPTHEYAAPGDYDIKLTVTGSMGLYGSNGLNLYCGLLRYTKKADTRNTYYQTAIRSVKIGNNVTNITGSAFQYCYGLETLTMPSGVTNIGSYAFHSCDSLLSITIPSGITNINECTFQHCHSLKGLMFSSSVTSIGESVFYNNYILRPVTIPSGVTTINDSAFRYCCSFAFLTIPSSVTSIKASAFGDCYGLGEIHFTSATPPTVSASSAFNGIPTDCKIYVPTGSLAAYTSATNYPSSSTYTYIEE